MAKDEEIHKAAYKADINTITEELKKGVDVNLVGASGRTALHRAVGGSHDQVVELLIKNKADVNFGDAVGRTPLFILILLDMTFIFNQSYFESILVIDILCIFNRI